MAITVTPGEFTLVEFDNAELVAIIERLLTAVGLPPDVDVTLDVDEGVPLGRAEITSVDPIVLDVEGGALEDPKVPRHLSVDGSADIVGRLLLRVRDRRDPAFGDPPPDGGLTLAHQVAWDVYCVARLARHGYRAQKQRRLYAFRNRHGFTDTADAAFEKLWTTEDLTWSQIEAISDAAAPVPA